jgi:OmpA-OmpF porin, OOP family
MKKTFLYIAIALPLLSLADVAAAQVVKKIKDAVDDNVSIEIKKKNKDKDNDDDAPESRTPKSNTVPKDDGGGADIKVYNNYDFVPGQTVLFEDNFMSDQDGEFPAHWKLAGGQGVMNRTAGTNAFLLTEGNYAMVSPRMKSPSYLADPFTFELDYLIPKNGGYGVVIRFSNGSKNADVSINGDGNVKGPHLNSNYPGDHSPAAFRNKWHHIAIAYKNNQLKVYVNQYRVMVDPDFGMAPVSLQICAIGSMQSPCIFTNVRIASGGGMNMIGKKFTDAKIITHGINFDYNKATIKPESMGTLNMITKIMTENPDVKFEVGGHTDGDGAADYNMTLSQQRADAVRAQLVSMGIDKSRLTTKGYGKTKPIADNTTEEGKANNRRVEFVKL